MSFRYSRKIILSSLLITCIGLAGTPPVFTAGADDADAVARDGESVATFAGGCFWCVESDFDHVPGVLRTISGYTGGGLAEPTYKDVSRGGTGHREAVQIVSDAQITSYAQLLDVFWRSVDPTDADGQFCDRGESYRTGIYASDGEQLRLAETSKLDLQASKLLGEPIVTPVQLAGEFYPAETYHQGYYAKNPVRYKLYRYSCGRDTRVEDLWGKQAHTGIEEN